VLLKKTDPVFQFFLRKRYYLKERSVDIVLFIVTETEKLICWVLYEPTFILVQVYSTCL